MRDFASKPSRTCRKSPLLMTPLFFLCSWAEKERVVRVGVHSLAVTSYLPGFIPGSGDVSPSSSPLELKKTSKVSWSEMSISSIWSSRSTFTSIDEMLPIGAAGGWKRCDTYKVTIS